jgi:phenylacetate-CoA ligase
MIRAAIEPVLEAVSRHVVAPLADWKNRSPRLQETAVLRKSQWWPRADLERQQEARLAAIVSHAREKVPFYREALKDAPARVSLANLASLPLLRKKHLRENRLELIATGLSVDKLLMAKTGGSTGTSLMVYFNDHCRQFKNSAAIRADEWAGWRLGASIGALWGNPPVYSSLRGKVFAALNERMIFCDTMLLNDEVVRSFNEQMHRMGVRYLFGHAHSLFRYCESLERQRLTPPRIAGIVSTSMMLLEPERALIERVLACPVTNRYGCEEVGLIACECERHSGLHVNEEHAVVELVDDAGRPVKEGEPGLVCVTDLINTSMPLIRYVVEDIAVMQSEPCDCGRAHRRLRKIVGRTADFLKRADGGLVAGVSLVELTLTAIEGVAQLQVIQDSLERVVINVVPGAGYGGASARALEKAFRDAMGPGIVFEVRSVTQLHQEKNGKYRFAICRC